MAEEISSEGTAPIITDAPIVINGQYIKDLSFDSQTAPGIFSIMQQTSPDVHIDVNVSTSEFEDQVYEVVLSINARCSVGEDIAFILELDYAGLFTLKVEDEVKAAMLLIECPRLLFPFARNIIAAVSRDGGFPPIMLSPIDFAALYQSELDKKVAAQGQDSAL